MAISTSGSSQSSAVSQPTLLSILQDPDMRALFGNIQGNIPTNLSSIYDLVGQGSNSPLMKEILSRGLSSLAPGEAASRQAVTDAFRASGGLRGTAYGQSFARNEGGLMQNQSNLIGDLLSKTLGTLVSGELQQQQNRFLPAKTMIDLFQASRPAVGQTSSSQSTSNYGGGGDSGLQSDASLSDWLRRIGYQPTSGGGGAYGGVNGGGGGGAPAAGPQPGYDPYGGYGYTNMSNPGYSDAYSNPYNPNPATASGNYNNYGDYAGSYGLGYQPPPYNPNPQVSYGPWQDVGQSPYSPYQDYANTGYEY